MSIDESDEELNSFDDEDDAGENDDDDDDDARKSANAWLDEPLPIPGGSDENPIKSLALLMTAAIPYLSKPARKIFKQHFENWKRGRASEWS